MAKKQNTAQVVMDPEALIFSLRKRAALLNMAALAVTVASGITPDDELAQAGSAYLFAKSTPTKKPAARKKAKLAKKVKLSSAKTKARVRRTGSVSLKPLFDRVMYENVGRELTTRQVHDELVLEGWVSNSANKMNIVNVYLNTARKKGLVTRTDHGWIPVSQVPTVAQDAVESAVVNA